MRARSLPSDLVVASGLLLDIVGAVVLAWPDVRRIVEHPALDDLRFLRDNLAGAMFLTPTHPSAVKRLIGETGDGKSTIDIDANRVATWTRGFDELQRAFRDWERDRHGDDGHPELWKSVRIFIPTSLFGQQRSPEVHYQLWVDDSVSETKYPQNEAGKLDAPFDSYDIKPALEARIRRLESRLRLNGLILLATGFMLQIIATLA